MIRVTDRAVREIWSQANRLDKKPEVRLGLRAGGCNGFSYIFDWIEGTPKEDDEVIKRDGIKIYVDPKSAVYLKDTEIDFETTLISRGFRFNSPKAKGSCGCGESIQFERDLKLI